MTRDEVARECERHGWKLTVREYAHLSHSPTGAPFSWHITKVDGSWIHEIGRGDSPREAYLEACDREGLSLF